VSCPEISRPGPGAGTYARLVQVVHARGAVAVLDSSGEALERGISAGPDWVKPNLVEAEHLVGAKVVGDREIYDAVATISQLGPKRVLLSLGERGAALLDGGVVWYAEPPRIREVSAVAAGDACLAGALWAHAQRMPKPEVVRWAVAAGTATAMVDGSAMPDRDAIRCVHDRVAVRVLQAV